MEISCINLQVENAIFFVFYKRFSRNGGQTFFVNALRLTSY